MGNPNSGKKKFASLLLLVQAILLILFVVFVDYSDDVLPKDAKEHLDSHTARFPLFQDAHVMVFLGFGLLMTFLRRYSQGSLVHSFLIAAVVVQCATLLQGFFEMEKSKVRLELSRMISADYAAMAILVAFGALVGKVNSLQLLVSALIGTFCFSMNEGIATHYLHLADSGRAMTVHVFGACFGLAVARVLFRTNIPRSRLFSSNYTSNMFAILGTIFLFVFWPSFNASFSEGMAQHRAIMNTYYALCASCVATVAFSILSSPEARINMMHLQNATISGGVGISAIAPLIVQPYGALLIGVVSALLSVLGYQYLKGKLLRLKIHDTRGVLATHLLPGCLSGVASAIAAATAKFSNYKISLYELYPARAPKQNTTMFFEMNRFAPHIPPGLGWDASLQAGIQIGGLFSSAAFGLIGGIIAGFILKQAFFDPLNEDDVFDDRMNFEETDRFIGGEDELDDQESDKEDMHSLRNHEQANAV